MFLRKLKRRKRREEKARKKLIEQQAKLLQMNNFINQKIEEEKEDDNLPSIDVKITDNIDKENSIINIEDLDLNQIKQAFEQYEHISEQNQPDFENDSLETLKEKLKVVMKEEPDPIKEKIKVVDNINDEMDETIDIDAKPL